MIILTETECWHVEEPVHAEPSMIFNGCACRTGFEGRKRLWLITDDGNLVALAKNGSAAETEGKPTARQPIDSLIGLHPDQGELLLGTEGARLYRHAGGHARACPIHAFDHLPCRNAWHTPWGGPPSVRSMAQTQDGWIYADIHVGSIMRSPDGGKNWEPVDPSLNEDVHQVATSRTAHRRVYANTARGVYISDDRGGSWRHCPETIGARYGRAVAVHPADPDCLLATVSDGPHGTNVHGQLYVSHDAGRSWAHIAHPFPPDTEANINTFHVAFAADGTAWACVGKTLFIGRGKGSVWAPFWDAPSRIRELHSAEV